MSTYSGITSHDNALPHLRLASMNKIGEIGRADEIDFFAGEENIENGVQTTCEW
jgi:hypothetical protein